MFILEREWQRIAAFILDDAFLKFLCADKQYCERARTIVPSYADAHSACSNLSLQKSAVNYSKFQDVWWSTVNLEVSLSVAIVASTIFQWGFEFTLDPFLGGFWLVSFYNMYGCANEIRFALAKWRTFPSFESLFYEVVIIDDQIFWTFTRDQVAAESFQITQW